LFYNILYQHLLVILSSFKEAIPSIILKMARQSSSRFYPLIFLYLYSAFVTDSKIIEIMKILIT